MSGARTEDYHNHSKFSTAFAFEINHFCMASYLNFTLKLLAQKGNIFDFFLFTPNLRIEATIRPMTSFNDDDD